MEVIDTLRSALLITLPVVLVAVLWRRFKQRTMARELPAPAHAELLELQVAYHPARLRALIKIPGKQPQQIHTALLNGVYSTLHRWPVEVLECGEHWLERIMIDLPDGDHYFEMGTDTQRTVRKFRLQQAVIKPPTDPA